MTAKPTVDGANETNGAKDIPKENEKRGAGGDTPGAPLESDAQATDQT